MVTMGLKSTLEKVADLITPLSATTDLDVAANREHLRSKDPERIRTGLRFLVQIGPAAGEARPEIESMLDHPESDIAALAVTALEAITPS